MGDDEKALLAAVIAHPDEDTPRLMYADWLDEHADEAGRARAEFIRVQCRRATLDSGDPEYGDLQRRERELYDRYVGVWNRPFKHWADRRIYARGFIEDVSVPENQFQRRVAEIFRSAPFRSLTIGASEPADRDFYTTYSSATVETLLGEPLVARLLTLRVPGLGLEEIDIESMASSKLLRGLVELDLSGNQPCNPRSLFGRGQFPALAVVTLGELEIDDRWVGEFVRCPAVRLTHLRRLDFTRNFLTHEAAASLADCPHLDLERLAVGGNDLDDDDLDLLRERFGEAVVLEELPED